MQKYLLQLKFGFLSFPSQPNTRIFLLFIIFRVPFLLELTIVSCGHSDTLDSNSYLENSLSAKEKIISELNSELHNIETALSNEREQHMNEIKKLNALLIEKVISYVFIKFCRFVLKFSFSVFSDFSTILTVYVVSHTHKQTCTERERERERN